MTEASSPDRKDTSSTDSPGTSGQAIFWSGESFRGRRWRLGASSPIAPDVGDLLFGASANAVLARRGIDGEAVEAFLDPKLSRDMPHPMTLKDMAKAASILADAVVRSRRVLLYGDYDVDGATSSAIMLRFLRAVGGRAAVKIPDRMTEGYGPNAEVLRKLAGEPEAPEVLVVLDSGTTAFEALGVASGELGLTVVVVDHHAAEPELPPVDALVNPNRKDESGTYSYLCTAGLAFLLATAVRAELDRRGWFGQARPRPKIASLLDIAALGTVADVVPLVGFNRTLVALGLKVMDGLANPGIRAMVEVANRASREEGRKAALEPPFKAWHSGFIFGPRINAAGRIDDSSLGARLLSTDDPAEAIEIAEHLQALNEERRAMCEAATDEAVDLVETAERNGSARCGTSCLVVAGRWHQGIIGIVAGRLKERFDKPVFVVDIDSGKSSGRSMPGFDMGAAVIEARQSGLLKAGGGHPMAAGLTVDPGRLGELIAFMDEKTRDLGASLYKVDLVVRPSGLTVEDVERFRAFEPFGQANPEPRAVVTDVRVAEVRVLKDKHVKLRLVDSRRGSMGAMLFSAIGTPLGDRLAASEGETIDVAGRLRLNEWNGRVTVELAIEDATLGKPVVPGMATPRAAAPAAAGRRGTAIQGADSAELAPGGAPVRGTDEDLAALADALPG